MVPPYYKVSRAIGKGAYGVVVSVTILIGVVVRIF